MSGYIGVQPVPQATQRREYFTATNGQATFNTNGYTPNYIDVYMNGVKLSPADFTASNGSDVVLASGATTGDLVQVVSFTPFNVANQTFIGDVNLSSGAYKIGGNTVIDSSRNATFATVGTPAGTAAAPAYTFSTDTNTGMFKRGTDQIGFSAGGTEMLALTSTGIFTNKLGSKSTGSDLTLTTSGDIILDANVAVSSDTYLSNASTTGSQITLNSDNTASWTGTRELISFESTGNGADHRTGTLSVKLKKGPSDSALTEFIQINAVSNYTAFKSGNVGIGVENPPKALTVFRTNQTDDTTVALLKLHAQFADASIEQNDKVAIQFAVQNSGGGLQTSDAIKFSYNNNLYLMEDGGDVAIGSVSDPSARLDISAPSNTAFGTQALKVRDGSYTTIQMDSGAADGRIQVGAAGTLRGVYKAQHAGTQTDHSFSLIQDNSSRLTIRDDRSVAHIDSGYRFDLGFFPSPSNTYQHFKTDVVKGNHMVFFEYKGYSYSSGGAVLTAMTVYTYTGAGAPYDPRYTRYGHDTANGFVNCYYSSDGYLVLVLKTNHVNGYTGGWMWAQSGHNFTDSNVRMLAQTSTSSNSGAY